MHWAHDAGASRIEFNPAQTEPFHYITPNGDSVTTELGETPNEYVDSMAQFIRTTIDGRPLLRPIRRLMRWLAGTSIEAQFEIPPTTVYSGSTWHCKMNEDTAVFVKQSSTKPLANAG